MAYKHLTLIQRCEIYGLWRAGHSQTEIAKEIGVHKSTISREFKRNIFWWGSRIPQYRPHYAQSYTDNRHKHKAKQIKFNEEVEAFVREELLEDWSPEQISGYAKRHNLFSISHERIYQFILVDKQKVAICINTYATRIKSIENVMAALIVMAPYAIVVLSIKDQRLLTKSRESVIGRLIPSLVKIESKLLLLLLSVYQRKRC